MSDQLEQFRDKENITFIFNFEDSSKNGRHWVLVYKRGDEKIFFDTYGTNPPIELQNIFGSGILYHDYQLQSFSGTYCGEWCILICYLLEHSKEKIIT